MKKRNKRRHEGQLDEMIEWQQNQYTPWHYSQKGKTIPGVSGEGNLKLKAIVITILGIVLIVGAILIIVSVFLHGNNLDFGSQTARNDPQAVEPSGIAGLVICHRML